MYLHQEISYGQSNHQMIKRGLGIESTYEPRLLSEFETGTDRRCVDLVAFQSFVLLQGRI